MTHRAMREHDIVELLKANCGASRDDVTVGIGDDAAVVQPAAGEELVLCTDTLVAGVHFPVATDPAAIGHKALAVNLSDLAAMGAQPKWALLALTLPATDDAWLASFAAGFDALAGECGVQLVGGDLTQGPLTVTVQLCGAVPAGTALTRDGAQPGDNLCVSGMLGDAALALALLNSGQVVPPALRARLDRPQPRVALGCALRGLATAAIDISDGLVIDVGRLAVASGVGATLWLDELPASQEFRDHGGTPAQQLAGGDDYELLFTLPPAVDLVPGCTVIGRIDEAGPVRVVDAGGREVPVRDGGYEHFR